MANLNDLVAEIKIESAYLPTIDLKDPFAPGSQPGAGHWVLSALKPKVTIVPRVAAIDPITAAPFGEPGPTHWPYVRVGLLALAGMGLAYGLSRALR